MIPIECYGLTSQSWSISLYPSRFLFMTVAVVSFTLERVRMRFLYKDVARLCSGHVACFV